MKPNNNYLIEAENWFGVYCWDYEGPTVIYTFIFDENIDKWYIRENILIAQEQFHSDGSLMFPKQNLKHRC